jgi:hypothetical protein
MAQRVEFEDTKGVMRITESRYLQALLAGPLYCLFFVDLVILITPLVSSNSIRWGIVLSFRC